MDYSRFRQTSSKGAAVSVNHKALITRALTKYPVDYALFRELLQNSADAQASSATIEFETSSKDENLAQIHGVPITRLRFTNDGLDFTNEDWNRLREIASGNPNETKIGAFGVGFYSVFELTEEPLVHSGHEIMNFKYEGIQLHYYFTEKAPSYQKGTLIDLPYRSTGQLPDLVKFVGFLVQSFVLINLNEVSVVLKYASGKAVTLLKLTKETKKPEPLGLLKDCKTKSPHGIFKLSSLQTSAVQVTLKYLNATQMPPLSLSKGFLSFGKQLVSSLVTTSGDPEEYTEVTCDLTRVDAAVDVSVSTNYRNKMIETLLKPPPKRAVMSLLSYTKPLSASQISSQLESYVFPKTTNDAKIFIGFPTKQSTGMRSHLGLNQLIPTMERTAVDMSNQFVKDWNGELLYMSGIMARSAYENELRLCKVRGSSLEDANFIYSRFHFGSSAPDVVIGLYIKEGFWRCSAETLVPTTQGIISSQKARFAGDSMKLLRTTPVVTNDELATELRRLKLVKEVSYQEIATDFAGAPLTIDDDLKAYVSWLADKWPTLDQTSRATLSSSISIKLDTNRILDLGSVRWYHDRSKLPDDEVARTLPRPCLPDKVALKIGAQKLAAIGIQPLSTEDWARFRLKHLETSGDGGKDVARGMLQVTAKSWDRLPSRMRVNLKSLFSSIPCIPTQLGLSLPQDAYIKKIAIFPDLPVISQELELPESWLKEIGLRESIAMSLVLEALKDEQLKWKNEDLVNYLVESSQSLQPSDWNVLQNRSFFSAHGQPSVLYRANQLYPPSEELKKLELPVLSFDGWSESSSQARILFKIGLRRFPSPPVLFSSVGSSKNYSLALKYFIRHYEEANYSWKHLGDLQVLPTTVEGVYAKPADCYSDAELSLFGKKVLDSKWEAFSSYLGVQKRPRMRDLLQIVLGDPEKYLSDKSQCDKIFTYFGRHLGEFGDLEVSLCRDSAFIPVRSGSKTADKLEKDTVVKWARPSAVFLPYAGTDNTDEDFMRPLLDTIYPDNHSRSFLLFVGVSDRPTLSQAVELLVHKPAHVLSLLRSTELYEALLIQMDAKWSKLSQNERLVADMKRSPFLLGLKYTKETETEDLKPELSLYRVSELAIVDDIVIFNQFKDKIITSPQDDAIESLYHRLGVPKLSSIMREKVTIGSPVDNEDKRVALQKHIRERLKLFLQNTSKTKATGVKDIEVVLVNSLQIERTIPPHSTVLYRTSAFMDPKFRHKILIVPSESLDWISVSSALIKAVLVKPDQDSIVVLEIQLSSDLDTLEKKGYNIQRIRASYQKAKPKTTVPLLASEDAQDSGALKQKGHSVSPNGVVQQQPPFAPNETQPVSRNNATQHPLLDSQLDSKVSRAAQNGSDSSPVVPPVSSQPLVNTQRAGSLFADKFQSMKKAFTGSSHSQRQQKSQPPQQQLQQLQLPEQQLHQSQQEPPQYQQHQEYQQNQHQQNQHQQRGVPDVNAELQRGLSKGRPFSSSHLAAPQYVDAPSPMNNSLCVEPQKVHNLKHVATLANGVNVFGTSVGLTPAQEELVLSEVLLLLCNIFDYPQNSVNIYRDPDTSSIAFNYNGSIFLNSLVTPGTASIVDYYYPVMAHELAHNLVSAHGASHSFYTESYIQKTLPMFFSRSR